MLLGMSVFFCSAVIDLWDSLFKALKIADDIESIIKRLESPKSWDMNVHYVSRKDIEELAERARKCAVELGGG